MSNKLTLSDIKNVINIHIEESRNFLMVVNKPLAIYISEYLDEEYDIVDEDEDLDNDEFYVNMWFDEGGIRFYCESAKGYDHYKFVDPFDQFVDYFIFTDTNMTKEEVDKYLNGDGTWSWCEMVEDVNDIEDCEENDLEDEYECPICEAKSEVDALCCCNECLEDEIKDSIGECLDKIFNDACTDCIVDGVVKLAYKCLEMGKENVKYNMMEFLDS
ncbi:MAG: hypothetical protein A2086_02750 [Spirochaetes bacterium GWD1_27_9]|nr:MAG: hypothetical protein A2086_02750 [Spirochaetes bacterium GWD1_27_9]